MRRLGIPVLRWTLTTRILAAFLVMLALISGLGTTTLRNLSALSSSTQQIREYNETMREAKNLLARSQELVSKEAPNPGALRDVEKQFQVFDRNLEEFMNLARRSLQGSENRKRLKKLGESRTQFESNLRREIERLSTPPRGRPGGDERSGSSAGARTAEVSLRSASGTLPVSLVSSTGSVALAPATDPVAVVAGGANAGTRGVDLPGPARTASSPSTIEMANSISRIRNTRDEIQYEISELLARSERTLSEFVLETDNQSRAMYRSTLVALGSVIVFGALLGFYLNGKVSGPIRELTATARRIEGGDLTSEPRVSGSDEVEELSSSLSSMTRALRENQSRLESMLSLSVAVAHEVRNPLAAIGGAVRVLGRRIADQDRPVVEEITRQIDRVNDIVTNLLIYARPVPLVFEPVDLAREVSECVKVFSGGDARVVFDVRANPEAGTIEADPRQLQQVLLNLIENAVHATGAAGTAGGTVRIETEPTSDGRVRISVRDDGPGVPEAAAARVFEPFFTTKPKGGGLGLAIARKIVEGHHGSISLVTPCADARGAEFRIVLPRTQGR